METGQANLAPEPAPLVPIPPVPKKTKPFYRTTTVAIRGTLSKEVKEKTYHAAKLYNTALHRFRENHKEIGYQYGQATLKATTTTILCGHKEPIPPSIPKDLLPKFNYAIACKELKNNPHYKALGSDLAQQTLKQADTDWWAFIKAKKAFRQNPENFQAEPKPPGYKDQHAPLRFLKRNFRKYTTKHPTGKSYRKGIDTTYTLLLQAKLKTPLRITTRIHPNCIRDITLHTINKNTHEAILTYTIPHPTQPRRTTTPNTPPNTLAIDLNTNLLAGITLEGTTLVLNHPWLVQQNEQFNNQLAKVAQQKQLPPEHQFLTRKQRRKAYRPTHKQARIHWRLKNSRRDFLHKMVNTLLDYAHRHDCTTIVLGWNKGIKQNGNIGTDNNRKFQAIPFHQLQQILTYKARQQSIYFVIQEESYTSKTDHLKEEPLKTWTPTPEDTDDTQDTEPTQTTTGTSYGHRRAHTYYSATGHTFSAHINGAIGILRKTLTEPTFLQWKNLLLANTEHLTNPQTSNILPTTNPRKCWDLSGSSPPADNRNSVAKIIQNTPRQVDCQNLAKV